LKREAGKLYFAPCLPAEWEGFSMRYRWGKTVYNIAVTRAPKGKEEMKVIVDNLEQDEKSVSLVDDGTEHKVDVII